MSTLEHEVRDRAAHYLTPEVARCAGLSLAQLQQVAWGGQALTHDQVQQLARRMGIAFVWTPAAAGKAA